MDSNQRKIKEMVLKEMKNLMQDGFSLEDVVAIYLGLLPNNFSDNEIGEIISDLKQEKSKETENNLGTFKVRNMRLYDIKLPSTKKMKLVPISISGTVKVNGTGLKVVEPPIKNTTETEEIKKQNR